MLCSGGDAHAQYKVNYESLCMNNMIWSQVFSSLTLILLVVCVFVFFPYPAHPIRIKLNVIVYISSFRDVLWLRIRTLDISSFVAVASDAYAISLSLSQSNFKIEIEFYPAKVDVDSPRYGLQFNMDEFMNIADVTSSDLGNTMLFFWIGDAVSLSL